VTGLTVGIAGCGLAGRKRAAALRGEERLVGCVDHDPAAAHDLAAQHGGTACDDYDALLALRPDVMIVATPHDRLAPLSERALEAGCHVLVEKPAGLGTEELDRLAAAATAAGRRVKVGFNHRFHPGIRMAIEAALSGRYGDVLNVRARYGHGGRPGYDREWRMQRGRSGGGELLDQGVHLLDLCHWLLGPLPLHAALLRTQFWDATVEDNAAVILGRPEAGPWATFHVSWTEWKNLFSLEICCRTAKLQVDGLAGSYGPQTLKVYAMRPELGPPDVEETAFPAVDDSWAAEWEHFRAALVAGDDRPLLGDLASARYAWECVEAAYAQAAVVP
jgi:predicted dehydrogenase